MVMKKNAMRRNLRQSIVKSFGRYVAITSIIALGSGLFLGLTMSKADMVATGQKYITEQNMFDLRMISNYGWSEEYVDAFAGLPGIESAEGQIYIDYIARIGENKDAVYRFYSIPKEINKFRLQSGRLPENDNECLADGYMYDDTILGSQVEISQTNEEDSLESVKSKSFTVVGRISSPLYMDMNRGNTSIGSGAVENYFFIPETAFDVDYYTEIHVTLDREYPIYSESYGDYVESVTDALEPQAEELAEKRFLDLKAEIEEEYNDGYQEYLDAVKEYEDGKAEAEQELADAEQELKDGEEELEDARVQMINAGNEIDSGYSQLETSKASLDQAKAEFASQKASAEALIAQTRAELDANAATVEANYQTALANIAAAQASFDQAASDASAVSGLQAQIEELKASDDPSAAATVAALEQQIQQLQTAYNTAQSHLNSVTAENQAAIIAKQTVDSTYSTLASKEAELASTEETLNAQESLYWSTKSTLDASYEKLMINWGKWGESRDELKEGWVEYMDAKEEVAQELAEAEAELADAEEDLREAREEIDSMEEPDLIILDRDSNVGYTNLDSSSNIVAGVSRVFPVFFLLIASLVCITTMTRMIDEERTQIGTLKALGYTNGEIINKYLVYSGSGAIIGCILGISLGCSIFPMVIWEAYKIMLYIQPNIILTVNWPLAIGVSGTYLVVMLLVTWYCCYKTLLEEPAQLIRPKAPEAGKQILLERMRIWKRLKFLNKVAIRNIFRYRQRLAMMLIGIGGCTALLIAGFGLRDSIVNIVDYQFRDVTHYDISVYFRDLPTKEEQKEFEKTIRNSAEDFMYYHQSSVELDSGDGVREIYMISAGEGLERFISLNRGNQLLDLPCADEVVVSVGAAEMMDLHEGDTVTVRSADLQEMELTVSGIYDNYVQNYCIVAPETIEKHWGEQPEMQMAFVRVNEDTAVHSAGAAITELDTVLNVSVSDDLATMVKNMMDALDLVVIVVVISAALLAVIVLYNLTNININERIREIATIKVLGFNAGETASYVFKENLVLTVVGAALGLGMGRLLLEFIMAQVKIDMVWFRAVLTPRSCVLAVLLTLLSTVAVEVIFYFKLDKINMAEALKSVE